MLRFCHELWQTCRVRQHSCIYFDHSPNTSVRFGGSPYKHILSPTRCWWQSKCIPTSIFFQQLQDFSIDVCWDFPHIFLVFSKAWYIFEREKPTTLTIKYSLYLIAGQTGLIIFPKTKIYTLQSETLLSFDLGAEDDFNSHSICAAVHTISPYILIFSCQFLIYSLQWQYFKTCFWILTHT